MSMTTPPVGGSPPLIPIQPAAPMPKFSPAHHAISAADDALLDATLEEVGGQPNIDLTRILEETFRAMETNEANLDPFQAIIELGNKSLDQCTKFFQDLLAVKADSLADWLKIQKSQNYRGYNPGIQGFDPFELSSNFKLQMDAAPDEQDFLDQKVISKWCVLYTTCSARLKAMRLETYLNTAPLGGMDPRALMSKNFSPQMDFLVAETIQFSELVKEFPDEKGEALRWLQDCNEDRKKILSSAIFTFSSLSSFHTWPEHVVGIKPQYEAFRSKIHALGLNDAFLQIFTGEIKVLLGLIENPTLQQMFATTFRNQK